MSTPPVENFLFTFIPGVVAERYDRWIHYSEVWNAVPGGQKAVDLVAVENSTSTTWLIEAKDFRIITNRPKECHISGLPETVLDKAMHTLAGLADAAIDAVVVSEKDHACNALAMSTKRIVLHLEEHSGPRSALFPKGFSALVLMKLRQIVKHMDPNPLVLSIKTTPSAGVPWTVV